MDLFEQYVIEKAGEMLDAINESRKGADVYRSGNMVCVDGLYLFSAICREDVIFNVLDSFGEIPRGFSANWRNYSHIIQELSHERTHS